MAAATTSQCLWHPCSAWLQTRCCGYTFALRDSCCLQQPGVLPPVSAAASRGVGTSARAAMQSLLTVDQLIWFQGTSAVRARCRLSACAAEQPGFRYQQSPLPHCIRQVQGCAGVGRNCLCHHVQCKARVLVSVSANALHARPS